jgi:hypothetical protein
MKLSEKLINRNRISTMPIGSWISLAPWMLGFDEDENVYLRDAHYSDRDLNKTPVNGMFSMIVLRTKDGFRVDFSHLDKDYKYDLPSSSVVIGATEDRLEVYDIIY